MNAALIVGTHSGTPLAWVVLYAIAPMKPTGRSHIISAARHSFTSNHLKHYTMKVEFLTKVWDMYRADVTAAIVELYIHRYDLGLTREQEYNLDTLNIFSLRKDLSRNLWECALFIDELLNDDEVSDFVNILLSESPRIENWPLCRILSQVLIGVHQVLVDIKREQWAREAC